MVWPLELCRMWVLQLGHVVVFCQRKLVVFTWTNSSEPRPFLDRGSLFELAGFSQAYWAWPGLARPGPACCFSIRLRKCVSVCVCACLCSLRATGPCWLWQSTYTLLLRVENGVMYLLWKQVHWSVNVHSLFFFFWQFCQQQTTTIKHCKKLININEKRSVQ